LLQFQVVVVMLLRRQFRQCGVCTADVTAWPVGIGCLGDGAALSVAVAVWWWWSEMMRGFSDGEVMLSWYGGDVFGVFRVWVVLLRYLIFWPFFKSVEICRFLLSLCWCSNLLRFAGFLCIWLTSTASVLTVWRRSASWDLTA
jgi:hypothetical protein